MLHGNGPSPASIPASLYPTPLSQYDPSPAPKPGATAAAAAKQEDDSLSQSASTKASAKGSAKKAKRKKGGKNRGRERENEDEDSMQSGIERLNLGATAMGDSQGLLSSSGGASALVPAWIKLSSSESDYSDTEGGQSSKLRAYHSKVRQCALACFHAVIKVNYITFYTEICLYSVLHNSYTSD